MTQRRPLKTDPLFRKRFIPWYDTDFFILITMGGGIAGLLFSMFGIVTALDERAFLSYIWVPCLLGALCLSIALSTLIRLYRRWTPEEE